ncbi:MAG: hypothetical protein V4628_11725 [Pseudomonadota bacterium]
MSCKHGEWHQCEQCDEVDAARNEQSEKLSVCIEALEYMHRHLNDQTSQTTPEKAYDLIVAALAKFRGVQP